MAAEDFVRVVAEGHSYRVWRKGKRFRCTEELPDGCEKEVHSWDTIPKNIWPLVEEASNQVLSDLPKKPQPLNPWENPHFRFGSLSSCLDCDGLAT